MEKIRATQLAGLEKFAGVVFEGVQGKYCLDEYAYFDDTSLFSTASFLPAAAAIAANTEQPLFNTPVGATGQGFPGNLTRMDTNLERGWQGGKAPQNQAYVATAGGFEIYLWDNTAALANNQMLPMELDTDIHQVAASVVWTWNVGGEASPRLNYEPIINWPVGSGISAIGATGAVRDGAGVANGPNLYASMSNGGPDSVMRKFTFPLFFPPNIAVDCRVRFAVPVTLTGVIAVVATSRVQIAMHLRGYKLSKLV